MFKINHTKAAPERQKNTEATCTGTWQAKAAESWDLVLLPAWLHGGRALALSCHWVPPQDRKSATELLLERGFNPFKDLCTLTLSPHLSKHTRSKRISVLSSQRSHSPKNLLVVFSGVWKPTPETRRSAIRESLPSGADGWPHTVCT